MAHDARCERAKNPICQKGFNKDFNEMVESTHGGYF